jgi:GntR family transcriptional regulator
MDFEKKRLNRDIPIPLYYQLKEILLESIKQAEKGSSFPTELELCKRFDVSRPTVRQAIIELVNEGFLYRIKGRGTFIAEPKIRQDFLIALKSFSEEMQQKGLTLTTGVLDFRSITCDERVGEALEIPVGSDVVQLERLRFADDEPVVLLLTFLPAAKLPGILERHFENESLYHIIEVEYGYTIDRAVRTLEARVAGERDAKLLDIKRHAPIQYIETIIYLRDNTPIEFSQAYYRGDRNTFTFELIKQTSPSTRSW